MLKARFTDDSSLADLYDVAMLRVPERLRAYLERRLRIGDTALAPHYAALVLRAPWRHIYTLNVDDLEIAVQRQFTLRARCAACPRLLATDRPQTTRFDVVHLNGSAGADATDLTFSTMQYASRLCARDREYERLVEDLQHHRSCSSAPRSTR